MGFDTNNNCNRSMYEMFLPKKNVVKTIATVTDQPEIIPEKHADESAEKKKVVRVNDHRVSRWATSKEVKDSFDSIDTKSDMVIKSGGVPMWYEDSMLYVDGSDNHTMIVGSTGSMKSRRVLGPTIRNLCMAGESMIVADPKGELLRWNHVKLKENDYNLKVLDLRDPTRSDRWNPLLTLAAMVKNDNPTISDTGTKLIWDLCYTMIPNSTSNDPYWENSARGLLYGLIRLLIRNEENPESVTFDNVIALKNSIFRDDTDRELFLLTLDDDDPVFTSMSATLINAENTRRCILSNLDSFIMNYISIPSVSSMMSESEIDLFKIGFEKTAVFIIIPDEIESMNFIVSTFVSETYHALIMKAQELDCARLPIRVNFILDEFGNIPMIKGMKGMITASRSRNIRFMLSVQSQNQLKNMYGADAETITSNCLSLIYLYSRDYEYLTYLCNIVGTDADGKNLISPSSLLHLNKENGEALVINGRMYPFISNLKDMGEILSTGEDCPYEAEVRTTSTNSQKKPTKRSKKI